MTDNSNNIEPGIYPIDQGQAEITPDPFTPGAWLLTLNGAESSQLNPDNPTELGFEYMRWIAAAIRHRFDPDQTHRLRILHLGAAGCNLARWAAAVYPGVHQTAIEYDAKLAELARNNFGLPKAPALKIRVAEAGEILANTAPARWDIIIRDVFVQETGPASVQKTVSHPANTKQRATANQPVSPTAEHVVPAHLRTRQAAAHAQHGLAPGGLYILNYGGSPNLLPGREETATMDDVFAYTSLIADAAMFKGRRRGNIIIIGSDTPLVTDATDRAKLTRTLLSDPTPAQLKSEPAQIAKFIGGAPVVTE